MAHEIKTEIIFALYENEVKYTDNLNFTVYDYCFGMTYSPVRFHF